jgi:hypothetical protein
MGEKLGLSSYGKRVFENRMLRRKLHKKLHNLYTSPNIIRVIKLKRVRWAGNVAYMG